jgi:hypothetical protein
LLAILLAVLQRGYETFAKHQATQGARLSVISHMKMFWPEVTEKNGEASAT